MNNYNIDKVVYICHEFGGKQENALKIEHLIKELSLIYPDICFISPVHTFGFLYDTVDYE